MKKINTLILAVFGLVILQACEGPEGPQGVPGVDGNTLVGQTFEVKIDFKSSNNYSEFFDFSEPLLDGDALLVYMLEESTVSDGRVAWRLLPQTFYLENGILVYNFDYTLTDFNIFLDDSPIDFSTLDPYWTNGVIFRVVVVPSDLLGARVDYTNFEGTMDLLNISEADFVRIDSKK